MERTNRDSTTLVRDIIDIDSIWGLWNSDEEENSSQKTKDKKKRKWNLNKDEKKETENNARRWWI